MNRKSNSFQDWLQKIGSQCKRIIRLPIWRNAGEFVDYQKITGSLRRINWKSPKAIIVLTVVAVGMSGIGVFLTSATSAYAITVNGQQVAIVKSKAEIQQVVNAVLSEKGKNVGQVAQTKDQIGNSWVRVKEYQLDTDETAKKKLSATLKTFVKGYVIDVNGQPVFTLGSKAQADEALKKVKDNYAQPQDGKTIESVDFQEKVEVAEVEIQPEQVTSIDKVVESLIKGKIQTINYQVQEKDTLWTIARNNDMRISELLDDNPGITPQTVLKIGKKIDIVKSQPYFTVIVKGTQTREEVIPFSTVSKVDGTLGPGKTKTITEGQDGSKQVSFRFTSKNGQNVEKVTLSEKVTEAPVNAVVAKGPAAAKTTVAYVSRGSGSVSGISWPLHGPITSPYGYRHGKLHTGIDIDGETGDPYYAAGDGVVVMAGWDGGYGNCLLIDHGNGVQTRYGHSSRLLVQVGQRVSKGQLIGLVGSTGNSTGSHLHFEIILNGQTVNPLGYL